jgi:hypothetical protein
MMWVDESALSDSRLDRSGVARALSRLHSLSCLLIAVAMTFEGDADHQVIQQPDSVLRKVLISHYVFLEEVPDAVAMLVHFLPHPLVRCCLPSSVGRPGHPSVHYRRCSTYR